jgi:cation diffusion facilitator CzcD-associated flavoprotein CzcO
MILVVGAGPTGLAVAYYLHTYKLPYCVLEKEEVGSTWQHHYDSLHLHTLKEVSSLPGYPMPADYPRFPSAEQVRAYLRDYARHFPLEIEEDTSVQHASYGAQGWQVQTSRGERQAHTLIVATGIWNTPVVPEFEGQRAFGGTLLHARDYRRPQPFEGQRVLVVGAGNSGAEIAIELAEHGVETAIAMRSGSSFVDYPTSPTAMRLLAWFFRTVPRPIGRPILRAARRSFDQIGIPTHPDAPLDAYPVVGYELPEAVAAGHIQVYRGMQRFVPGGVRFADGQEAAFDSVIMATGYRPTLDFVRHELELDEKGVPLLRHWRSVRNPHLYCVGFTYPTTSGFLQSLDRVARDTVRQVSADHQRMRTRQMTAATRP